MSFEFDLAAALRNHFGLTDFREGQREVVETILGGGDALVVRPTGSGKSLCYQLPAVLLPGVTVVVSPLIALMKDQIDALAARGLPAFAIHSGLGPGEAADALADLRSGRARLCYVAPERFRVASFLDALAGVNVSLLAVDEAHCVSEWGHEFRPDYRRLGAARAALGRPPVVALTATATARVRRDILDELEIPEANVFVSGFDRPNLRFEVAKIAHREDKIARLRGLVDGLERSGGAGLIYCATRRRAEEVARALGVGLYHAGLEPGERARVQDRFMAGGERALVATNAFGMGIDRPDIRFVAHAEMPRSLEAYYQEAGRAGRDGAPARCVLLYTYPDRLVHDYLIDEGSPGREVVEAVWRLLGPERGPGPRPEADVEKIGMALRDVQEFENENENQNERWRGGSKRKKTGRKSKRRVEPRPRGLAADAALKLLERAGHVAHGRDRRRPTIEVLAPIPGPGELRVDWTAGAARRAHERDRLETMLRYAQRESCRTREILRYFGDRSAQAFRGECGHCDRCAEDPAMVARKVLSGIVRLQRIAPPAATPAAVADCLAGARPVAAGHERLPTYGLLRAIGPAGVLAWIDALARGGMVASGDGGRLSLTPAGIEVMAGRAALPA